MVYQPLALSSRSTKKYQFAPKIKIHDVTLRDGEQQTAVVFRREEKVAIARQLDALGVHRIEAGMPAVSEQDEAAIQDIAALGLKSKSSLSLAAFQKRSGWSRPAAVPAW